MALTVTHAKNVAIADDPKAAAAGEVLPSDWNANHTVSGVALDQAGGNLTFYVATSGSDSNPGTSLLPFRTIARAVSVALGFNYQALYTCTINVAHGTYIENGVVLFGLIYALSTDVTPNAILIGDPLSPTSVVITSNNGGTNPVLETLGGHWAIDGISIRADSTAVNGNSILLVADDSVLFTGTIDIDTSTGANYGAWISSFNYSAIQAYGNTAGNGNITFHGDGATCFEAMSARVFSNITWGNIVNLVFNSAINLQGSPFISIAANSKVQLNGITFTNPGNITGGAPFSMFAIALLQLGFDPTSATLPGGAFDPTQIDASSVIDGIYYAVEQAGAPVDQSTIYRGSWSVSLDTNTNGAATAFFDHAAGTVEPLEPRAINRTVATLPSAPATGMIYYVHNALAPAAGSAVVGGGAANALVWWNGAQWTVIGI